MRTSLANKNILRNSATNKIKTRCLVKLQSLPRVRNRPPATASALHLAAKTVSPDLATYRADPATASLLHLSMIQIQHLTHALR